jgi:hypothetical protein
MGPLARRRILLLALEVAAVLAVSAVAFGQDLVPIKITAVTKVTPNKAGTPKHPQGINIDVNSTIDTPRDYDPPLAQTVDVWISKGGVYNGGKYPTCSPATMELRGIGACPKGSIMGTGKGKADADGVFTYPTITVVNGGAHTVHFYTVLTNPARVRKAVEATRRSRAASRSSQASRYASSSCTSAPAQSPTPRTGSPQPHVRPAIAGPTTSRSTTRPGRSRSSTAA